MNARQRVQLFGALKARFETNMHRHKRIEWSAVLVRLGARPEKLRSLEEMERSGGEPDVVAQDPGTAELVFFDCSAESPAGRRSVCYDREGLESRKEHRPHNSAIDMATGMGVELLSEDQYRDLQRM